MIKVQCSNRYRLKIFIDWVMKQGWLCEVEEKEAYSFSPKPNWKVRISNRIAKPTYKLKDSEVSRSLTERT